MQIAYSGESSYACYKHSINYDTYEFYESSNFDYETQLSKDNNEKGYFIDIKINSNGIEQRFYLSPNDSDKSISFVSEEEKNLLLCFVQAVEYQFDLSKYGCFKNKLTRITFLDFNFNEVKKTPFSYIKCLTKEDTL